MKNVFAVIVTLLGVPIATVALAASPDLISYQGILRNGGGTPQSGTFNVTFAVYATPAGGAPLWSESQSVTTGADGLFNVLLGSVTPLDELIFADESRYLGIAVNPDGEMTPRQQFTSVAYSHRAGTIDGASGGMVTGQIEATGSDNKIRFLYQNYSDLPAPGTYHGMFAHVHGEDAAYYAHSSQWVRLADSAHTHGASGIDDEAGVAGANSSTTTSLTSSMTTLESSGIVAPSAGYVVAIGSCELLASHSLGTGDSAQIGVSDAPGQFEATGAMVHKLPSGTASGEYATTITTQAIFPVSVGSNVFYLTGQELAGSYNVGNRQLSLIFFPTTYGTVEPPSPMSVMSAMQSQRPEKLEVPPAVQLDQLSTQMSLIQHQIDVLRQKLNTE